MKSKKQNKWTNKTKQKQTIRYREQTGDCQSGEELGDMWLVEGDEEVQTSSYKINKSWGCNVQHREYNQKAKKKKEISPHRYKWTKSNNIYEIYWNLKID